MADILRKEPAIGPSEDIGDVLTSIRRLIAQDGPPSSHSESATDRLRQLAISQAKSRAGDAISGPRQHVSPTLVLTRKERVPELPASVNATLSENHETRPAVSLDDHTPLQQPEDDMTSFQDSHQPEPALRPAAAPLQLAPQPQITPVMADMPATYPQAATTAAPAPVPDVLNLFSAQQTELPADPPLHGLIRNAVIREMEGELGSRLTRNLRQLIRAEIAQALQEATQAR